MVEYFHHFSHIGLVLALGALSWSLCSAQNGQSGLYLGCANTSEATGLNKSPGEYDEKRLTPATCARLCHSASFNYAALSNGVVCSCGKAVSGVYGGSCHQPCPGDTNLYCGGVLACSVYDVRSGTDMADLVIPAQVTALDSVNYQVTLTLGFTSAGFKFAQERTRFKADAVQRSYTSQYTYEFTEWGTVEVLIQSSGDDQSVLIECNVDVALEANHLPDYPGSVEMNSDFEYCGRLTTGLNVSLSITLNNVVTSFYVPDMPAIQITAPIPRWSITSDGKDTNNGLVLTLTSPVTSEVVIIAWEMNVNKSGDIEIMILRPSCGETSVYCPLSGTCCLPNDKFTAHSVNEAGIVRNNTIQISDNYTVVYHLKITVTAGYFQKKLTASEQTEYRAGDIVAYIKTSASATLSVDPTIGKFNVITSVSGSLTLNSTVAFTALDKNNVESGSVMLNGIASKSTRFCTTLSATTPGNHAITVRQATFTGQDVSIEKHVDVFAPIANISLQNVFPSPSGSNSCIIYAPLDVEFNITVHLQGTKPISSFYIQNITSVRSYHYNVDSSGTAIITHNFTIHTKGSFPFMYSANNEISGETIHAEIHILEIIRGLQFTFNFASFLQGFPSNVSYSIDTGDNVTYTIHFDDGRPPEETTSNIIEHAFGKEGTLNVTVNGKNPVSEMNASVLVNVINPVILELPDYGVNGSLTNITCMMPDNFSDPYQISLMVKNTLLSSNCSTITYVFNAVGFVDVSCNIVLKNGITIPKNGSLYIMVAIKDLEVEDLPIFIVNSSRTVVATITSGTNVTFTYKINGTTVDTQNGTGQGTVILNFEGKYNLTIIAWNLVSVQHVTRIITAQIPIGTVTIVNVASIVPSFMLIPYEISISTGSSPKYSVSVGNNQSAVMKYMCDNPTFNHTFEVEGPHDIDAFVNNDISNASVMYTIDVQHALFQPINITVLNYQLWENNNYYVISNEVISFAVSTSYGTAAKVRWLLDGNPVCSDASTVNVPNTTESNCNISFVHSGTYIVTIQIENAVSSINDSVLVVVQHSIVNFHVTALLAVPLSEPHNVVAQISQGTNVTYQCVARNEQSREFQNDTFFQFNVTGIFIVRCNAWNKVSNASFEKTVIVQEKIFTVRIVGDTQAFEMKKEVILRWEVDHGTNVSCEITWGDDTTKEPHSYTKYDIINNVMTCNATHEYWRASRVNITIVCANKVSGGMMDSKEYFVDQTIESLSIRANTPPPCYVYQVTTFIVEIKKGSNVNFSVNFGDTSDNSPVITSRLIISKEKEYGQAGVYNVSVSAKNHISSSFASIIFRVTEAQDPVKIEGLVLSTRDPVVFGNQTKFVLSYKAGARFSCTFDYGVDGEEVVRKTDAEVNKDIEFMFPDVGVYTTSITCSNELGTEQHAIEVAVDKEIKEFNVDYEKEINSPHGEDIDIPLSWAEGSNVKVVATRKDGKDDKKIECMQQSSNGIKFPVDCLPPGRNDINICAKNGASKFCKQIVIVVISKISGFELKFNEYQPVGYKFHVYPTVVTGNYMNVTMSFGDNTSNITKICTGGKEICSFSHKYSRVGEFILIASAINELSTKPHTVRSYIRCQNGLDGWSLSSNGTTRVDQTSFLVLQHNDSYPLPTNATYTVTTVSAEGNDIVKHLVPSAKPLNDSIVLELTFSRPGCHKVRVTLQNNIGTFVIETEVKVLAIFNIIEINVVSKRAGNFSTKTLPLEYPVNISIKNPVSNCLQYNWTITGENGVVNKTDEPWFEYLFDSSGNYTVHVIVSDAQTSAEPSSVIIEVDASVTGLIFVSEGVASVGNIVTFCFICTSAGESPDFVVNFGDGSPEQIVSATTNRSVDFRKDYSTLNLPINPIGYIGSIFNHSYSTNGTYEVVLTPKISARDISWSNVVWVTNDKPCPLPMVVIDGANADFKKASKVRYGLPHTISSVVISKCVGNIKSKFEWKFFMVDEYLAGPWRATPPQEELIVPLSDAIPTNQSSITLTRKSLEPMRYIVQLRSSFENFPVGSKQIVYLHVTAPPIVFRFQGGIKKFILWKDPLVLKLDAVDSYWESRLNDLKFQWTCEKLNLPDEEGGCFGSGKYLTEFTKNIITIPEMRIVYGFVYIFSAMANRISEPDEKSIWFNQSIQSFPGEIPLLSISCESNCQDLVNPSERLSLISECKGDCDEYEWQATVRDLSLDMWWAGNLTSKDSPNLVLEKDQLNPDVTYIFKLTVTSRTGAKGFAMYEVKVNTPPTGGTCDIDPKEGYALQTAFNFSCSGWIDDNDPSALLEYHVSIHSPGDLDNDYLIYSGTHHLKENMKLPLGQTSKIDVHIKVSDVYGAAELQTPIPIKILRPENVTYASPSIVEEMAGSGDISNANFVTISYINDLRDQQDRNITTTNTSSTNVDNMLAAVLKAVPTDNLELMGQTIGTVISAITKVPELISSETQYRALDTLQRYSERMREEAKEDIGNAAVDEQCFMLFVGASNILQLLSDSQTASRELVTKKNISLSENEQENVVNKQKSSNQAFEVLKGLAVSVLTKKVDGEKPTKFFTSEAGMVASRTGGGDSFNGLDFSLSAETKPTQQKVSSLMVPKNIPIDGYNRRTKIDASILFMRTMNPQAFHNSSGKIDSPLVTFELKKSGGEHVNLNNLTEDIELVFERKDRAKAFAEERKKLLRNETVRLSQTSIQDCHMWIFKPTAEGNAFHIEVTPEVHRSGNVTLFFFNTSMGRHSWEQKHELFFGRTRNNSYPTVSLDLSYKDITNKTLACALIGVDGSWLTANYTISFEELGCYYWDENEGEWITKGCKVGYGSTRQLLRCLCNHATMFSSNFFVKPNVIDPAHEIANLSKLLDSPALIATICIILGLYVLAMVWARRKDRREIGQETLHVSIDNDPGDSYRYEVIICTGSRRNAGSTAEISLMISGSNGNCEPRCLQRVSALSFQRSSQDAYLVTTPYSLGELEYIRVWHDNAGTNASLYLTEVIINDVQVGHEYMFLCNNWLACDEGDGLVERLLPVASPEDLKDFHYLFTQNSSQGFSDSHLWFSIVLRPPQNRFTHSQRVTCCLCLLLCTMLTNAMFFGVGVAKENNVDVDIGPYQFSWHEVMIGIQSSLIVFPINLLIVTLFRRIAPRPRKSAKYVVNGRKTSKGANVDVSLRDIDVEKKKRAEADQMKEVPKTDIKPSNKNKEKRFPWWFVYITWFLVIAVSITAGFFTILYGISFDKAKQERWLTALFVATFQDIFISQPLKIFVLAILISFILRKPNPVRVHEDNQNLVKDEEWIQENTSKINPDGLVRERQERRPPDELLLKKVRLAREKERKMFALVKEVLQFFLFWWILLMISFGHREPDAHLLTTSMESMFVASAGSNWNFQDDGNNDLAKTRNERELYHWAEEVVIPKLSHTNWYNGRVDRQKGAIADSVGHLIGTARLRMLRVNKGTCRVPDELADLIEDCEDEYSFSNEYQEKYNTEQWKASNVSNGDEKWTYRTQTELHERPFVAEHAMYRGGGYVLKLSNNEQDAYKQINETRSSWWIDGETRVVFLEFTVFSPNKNLYSIVTIYFECPAAGGCSASSQILTTRLDELIGNYRIFVLFLELFFVIYLIVFTYLACKDILKHGRKYWKMFWNWIEMIIVVLGWTCVAFYILRFIANKWTMSAFHEDPNSVAFRYVATADQLYTYVLAFVVFFTSIKFLRLFRFNRRMSLLGSTLKYAAWDLINFFIMFVIAFMACSSVAYLLFCNNIDMFSSYLGASETLLNIILGKFKYMNMSHDTFVGTFVVIFVYVLIVVFILMNVFLAILNDSFQVVKADNDLQDNEYEIVDYIAARIKGMIGIKTKRPVEKSDFEFEYGFRPEYIPPETFKVPAAVVLDKKAQELLDVIEKQADQTAMEDARLNELSVSDNMDFKAKALLFLVD